MFNFWTLNVPVPLTPAIELFEQALVARLQAAPGVAALVGSRIRPGALDPKDRLPALAYSIPSVKQSSYLDGAADQHWARVQISAFGRKYSESKALAAAVAEAIPVGFRGDLGGGIMVTATWQSTQTDLWEPPDDGSSKGTHHVTFDLRMNYRRSS